MTEVARTKSGPALKLTLELDTVEPSYRGILVVVEQRQGVPKPVSWQLLGQGRRLADQLGVPLMALVLGYKVQELARQAVGYGADQVFVCDAPELYTYRSRPYSQVYLDVIRTYRPEIVLIGATYTGRDLAGTIATRLPTGLTADCTQLDVDEHGLLLASRPTFSEKMLATIVCKTHRPQMATARPGVFQARPYDAARSGTIIDVQLRPDFAHTFTEILEFIQSTERVYLDEAEVIVAGGRGVGGKEGFSLLGELARELGGVVGASRAAVDLGWISHDRQVGQTGATVHPKLYIAVGISGAVQHLVGMDQSRCIVSINKDPEAPIHKVADFAIADDLFQVVPALIEAVKASKAGQVPVMTGRG
ncbi:MAG: electron transfer flavoprotein subunit alpha/FixB family protein [Alicyclobacillus sp.]|nr:electron transfer flavoprotein subunit alpha/FixB family protein [Alicyclobacillus sp.]